MRLVIGLNQLSGALSTNGVSENGNAVSENGPTFKNSGEAENVSPSSQ